MCFIYILFLGTSKKTKQQQKKYTEQMNGRKKNGGSARWELKLGLMKNTEINQIST
jgi:hypothetical protein